MKWMLVVIAAVVCGGIQGAFAEEPRRRDACEKIPKRALERAHASLKSAYPSWDVTPTNGNDGDWRCRTSGTFVRRYDRTIDDERLENDVPLFVDKDGSIYIYEANGCYSIDRWKK